MEKSVFASIADNIKEQIANKIYKTGDFIPSENTLCNMYNVTRTTIRRALSLLLQDNTLSSIPGKGYTVNPITSNQFRLQFDEKSCTRLSIDDTQLMGVEIILPSIDLILKMHIQETKKIINIKRLFLHGDTPVAFDNKFIPYSTGIPIIEHEIKFITFPSMFAKKMFIREFKEKITIAAQKADPYIASLLEIEHNAPVMLVEQKIDYEEGTILGWAQTYYTKSAFELTAESI